MVWFGVLTVQRLATLNSGRLVLLVQLSGRWWYSVGAASGRWRYSVGAVSGWWWRCSVGLVVVVVAAQRRAGAGGAANN